MIDNQFLAEFKRLTESRWAAQEIDPKVFGFQFQRGTKWLPGIPEDQISAYEGAIDSPLPDDLKTFLRKMNGTDLPTVNVYGSGGEPHRQSVGVYSYPQDLECVRSRIETVREHRAAIVSDLESQGFELGGDSKLVPIYAHRYVIAAQDLSTSVVLSIVVNGIDVIVYGNSLQEYLAKEFLGT